MATLKTAGFVTIAVLSAAVAVVFADPPPVTETLLTNGVAALAEMFTVTVIGG